MERLKKHYRDSVFIPFTSLGTLQAHIDWLNLQLEGCDPKRDTPRRHWLLDQRRAAKTEIAWRQNRDLFSTEESDDR